MKRASIGVFLSTRLAGICGDDPGPFLSLADQAESAGFHSVWVGDSLTARPRLEPLTMLSAIAARTKRLTLGTAVLLPALRHPLVVAHAVATLDRLAGGRLVLGVGSGFAYPGTETELAAVGVTMSERGGRVVESIAIWRKLWGARAPVSHQGRFWAFREVAIVPQPTRPEGPPLWMGGNAPAAVRRAGRLADGFFPTSATPEAFHRSWEGVLQAAAVAGRPADAVTPAVVLTVNVGHEREVARRELREYMEAYYGAPLDLLSTFIGCHAGTADECAEWISRYTEAGVRHVVLRFASSEQLAQLERIATDVLPVVAAGGRAESESVARAYAAAWRRGDRETLFGLVAEDVVLHYFGRNPLAGTHVGRDAVVRVLATVQERTSRELVAIDDVLASDAAAALLVRERFRRDGRTAEMARLLVYRVSEGRFAECWLYDQDQRAIDDWLSLKPFNEGRRDAPRPARKGEDR